MKKTLFSVFIATLTINMYARELYDKQWPFCEGFARVMRIVDFNGYKIPLYGFIDKTGKEAIPLLYDYAEDFSCGVALVGNLNKARYNADGVSLILQPSYTYVTKHGEELNYSFYFASSANKERASVLLGTPFIPYGLSYSKRLDKLKWQYKEVKIIDLLSNSGLQDKLNLPTPYDDWGKTKDNAVMFSDFYTLSDKLPTCYVRDYYKQNYELTGIKKWEDLKENEHLVKTVSDVFNVVCQHGLCGIRNSITGKLLIPCAFGDIIYLGKDKFAVEYHQKWAVVDSRMNYITRFVYDKIKPTNRKEDITDSAHWIYVGNVESTYTYEWGHQYNYKWLSFDLEKAANSSR